MSTPPRLGRKPKMAYDGLVFLLDHHCDRYPPGTRLPSVPKLAEMFEVTGWEVQIALRVLHEEGRVRMHKSQATLILDPDHPLPVVPRALTAQERMTAVLRARIEAGALPHDVSLVPLLMQEFGASKTCVYRWLRPLISEGVLVSRSGRGVYLPRSDTSPTSGTGNHRVPPGVPVRDYITAVVRARIEAGTLPRGIPLVALLAEEFYTTDGRVRMGLAPLVREKLLVARTGWGTYLPRSDTSLTSDTGNRPGRPAELPGDSPSLSANRLPDAVSAPDRLPSGVRVRPLLRDRVAAVARARIEAGTLPRDVALVPILSRECGVGEHRTRQGLKLLVQEGLLVNMPGFGIYLPSGEGPPERYTGPSIEDLTAEVRARIKDSSIKPGEPVPEMLVLEYRITGRKARLALAPLVSEGLLVAGLGGITVPATSAPRPEPMTGARLQRIVWARIVNGTIKPGQRISGPEREFSLRGRKLPAMLLPLINDGFLEWNPQDGIRMLAVIGDAQLREIVWARIATGLIHPGRFLSDDLTREFGVSGRAVQSALAPLIVDGYLALHPETGIYMPALGEEQIREIVRARIATGLIQPGQRISVPLKREYGISGPTIRSALDPLAREGHLAYQPAEGFYVPPTTRQPLRLP
ncbi:GntR family transcriptional regulator [Streptomyces sp. OfavH-34-F]|uniref:GntR family transcriptional regulator n=1 Tax=Streptomyces sp. OfavH-34-F TaxID=2917760 RepID=UPI001EF194F6|nr:GntR family transcriptional regulator [Streptomyces sp. OfavH-34-F]MCG7523835.1 GntR family transcriptional regulator [Streptomyces sp. OfavH-34-F]